MAGIAFFLCEGTHLSIIIIGFRCFRRPNTGVDYTWHGSGSKSTKIFRTKNGAKRKPNSVLFCENFAISCSGIFSCFVCPSTVTRNFWNFLNKSWTFLHKRRTCFSFCLLLSRETTYSILPSTLLVQFYRKNTYPILSETLQINSSLHQKRISLQQIYEY